MKKLCLAPGASSQSSSSDAMPKEHSVGPRPSAVKSSSKSAGVGFGARPKHFFPGAAAAAVASALPPSTPVPGPCDSPGEQGSAVSGGDDMLPCIQVQGFPDSWRVQQVRLVFALFGGVTAVRFYHEGSQQRIARVQLKNRENMQMAAEQLNNTQVGDGELIEECTIACRLLGGAAVSESTRRIFVDELTMTCRPDVQPSTADRELFLQNLPVRDCTVDQIRGWLEGFGQVEDVFLLRDARTGAPSGKGYVRFVTHREAAACVEAQASVADAEEGDVVAHWSESERAMQQGQSVYGFDVHSVFFPRALEGLKRNLNVNSLAMVSEKDPLTNGAPISDVRQLHFTVDCSDEQLPDVYARLGKLLEDFHKHVARNGGQAAVPMQAQWGQHGHAYGAGKGDWHADAGSKGDWKGVRPAWSAAGPRGFGQGGVPPERHTGDKTQPHGTHEVSGQETIQEKIERGEALVKEAQQLAGKGGHAKKAYEKYCRGLQSLLDVMPKLPEDDPSAANLRGRVDGYLEEAERLKARMDAETRAGAAGTQPAACGMSERGGDAAVPDAKGQGKGDGNPESRDVTEKKAQLRQRLERGEALMNEGRAAEEKNQLEEAYEKYCRGLQYVLEVMPQLGEEGGQQNPLRGKVSGYLERAERLKEKLETAPRGDRSRAPATQDVKRGSYCS